MYHNKVPNKKVTLFFLHQCVFYLLFPQVHFLSVFHPTPDFTPDSSRLCNCTTDTYVRVKATFWNTCFSRNLVHFFCADIKQSGLRDFFFFKVRTSVTVKSMRCQQHNLFSFSKHSFTKRKFILKKPAAAFQHIWPNSSSCEVVKQWTEIKAS